MSFTSGFRKTFDEQRSDGGLPERVWLSAKTGEGLDVLLTAMTELLSGGLVSKTIILQPTQAKLRSQLYQSNFVTAEQTDETGTSILDLRLPKSELDRLAAQGKIRLTEHMDQCGRQSVSLAPALGGKAGSVAGT